MQFDADTVGTANPAADAEMCMLAADTLEALGLQGHYVVKVSNRKISGRGDGSHRPWRSMRMHAGGSPCLRAIDKADKFGLDEIKKLLAQAAMTRVETSRRARV